MSEKVIKKFEDEMKDFKDRLELLETKMGRLEQLPKELQELKDGLVEVIGVSLIALDIDSSIHDFVLLTERLPIDGVLELTRTHLKQMKKFVEKYDKEPWKEAVSMYMKRWVSLIFTVVSLKKIKFDDFCSIIIENLGSDIAKKTIALKDIVQLYGAENATTWKKLIK